MELEVCNYQKFGFCKFKEQCKKKHLKELCKDLSACVDPRSCHKRHPRGCKRYALEGFCRFGDGCGYHHKERLPNKSILEVNKKVEELEKALNKMADKIFHLEVELKEIKLKEKEAVKIKEATQDPKIDTSKKGNFMDSKEKKLKPKDSKSKDSVFKFGAEARKTVSIEGEAKEKNNQLNISVVTFVTTNVRNVLL